MIESARDDSVLEIAQRSFGRDGWLDMSAIAAQAGISRATLYRRWGSREQLLGEVLWSAAEAMYAVARRIHPGRGPEAVVAVLSDVLGNAATDPAMQRMLREHPTVAVRVLTAGNSPFQQRVRKAIAGLIRERMGEPEGVDADDLAYAVQRLAESFYHREALTGEPDDLEMGMLFVRKLLEAIAPGHHPLRLV